MHFMYNHIWIIQIIYNWKTRMNTTKDKQYVKDKINPTNICEKQIDIIYICEKPKKMKCKLITCKGDK